MEEVVGLICQCGLPLILLFVAWLTGTAVERSHFSNLRRREQALAHVVVTNLKTFPGSADPGKSAALVVAETVISSDYLKSFLAGIRKILGGELRSFQSLMTRARREAMLRIMEQAHHQGYNAVCNLRMDTAAIGGMQAKGIVMVSVMASGTAYRMQAGSGS